MEREKDGAGGEMCEIRLYAKGDRSPGTQTASTRLREWATQPLRRKWEAYVVLYFMHPEYRTDTVF